jgi:UDP-N-acetylmuramoyl-tripeptide--D-alanyl-D-alanine ligase
MFNIKEIYEITNGKNINCNNDFFIKNISINSKTIKENSLFIAIKGCNKDGHNYIRDAVSNGAKAVLISNKDFLKDLSALGVSVILVEDTSRALNKIAFAYKKKFKHISFLGITGSNGKTTTKEMIFHILSKYKKVFKTQGNFNNLIGVPLSLFDLKDEHEFGVVEMGTSLPGEIKEICDLVEPEYGLLTNISASHLQGLKNIEQIAEEKSALIKAVPNKGVLFLNADDENLMRLKTKTNAKIITFGIKNKADYMASNIKTDFSMLFEEEHMISHSCEGRNPEFNSNKSINLNLKYTLNSKDSVNLKCQGIHNVYNSLSAIAVSEYVLGKQGQCFKDLEDFNPAQGRFNIKEKNNIVFIDDTYNANPMSFKRALETLEGFQNKAERFIIFAGDMLELGDKTEELHFELGKMIANFSPDILFLVGKYCEFTYKGILEVSNSIKVFKNINENNFDFIPKQRDVILFKGSRGLKMERFYEKVLLLA